MLTHIGSRNTHCEGSFLCERKIFIAALHVSLIAGPNESNVESFLLT